MLGINSQEGEKFFNKAGVRVNKFGDLISMAGEELGKSSTKGVN